PLIGRPRQIPDRSVGAGPFRDGGFLHELAVLLEHLDAIVLAIADVHHAVPADLDARDDLEVAAVALPGALERAAVRVEHRDAHVAVIGDVELVRALVDRHAERTVEVRLARRVGLAGLPDLRHELAALVELHHLRVSGAGRSGRRAAASATRRSVPSPT